VQRDLTIECIAVDSDATEASHSIGLTWTTSLSTAAAFAAAYGAVIQAVSEAAIHTINLHIPYIDPMPTPGGDAWNVGVFIFRDSGGNLWDCAIPGIAASTLLPDGLTIDQANPDVAAFVDAIITGLGGVAPISPSPWSLPLVSLEAAYRQWRPTYEYVRMG
jgi:hypothetical protein